MRRSCSSFWLRASVLFFAITLPIPGAAAEKSCSSLYKESWSAAERQAWDALCSGHAVDFRRKTEPNATLDAAFVTDILLNKTFHDRIRSDEIAFYGAFIKNQIIINNAKFDKILKCNNCVFLDGAQFGYLRSEKMIDFGGSHFGGPLKLFGLSLDSTLFLKGVEADLIDLSGAHITQNLNLIDCYVHSAGGDQARQVKPSDKDGTVLGREIRIDGDVLLIDAIIDRLIFSDAKIGGSVKFDHDPRRTSEPPYFKTMINFGLAEIGGNFYMRDDASIGTTVLSGASVKHDLEISGSVLNFVDASNLSVVGELRLIPSDAKPTTWGDGAKLSLHNATVTKMVVSEDSLPPSAGLDIRGFVFKQFDFVKQDKPSNGFSLLPASSEIPLRWVKLSRPYSPQPYLQFAQVLKDSGYEDYSVDVRKEQLEEARRSRHNIDWLWETIKHYSIGYGYDLQNLLWPAGVFLFVGWGMVHLSPTARNEHFGFGYSLDLLLPIIRLREKHYTTDLPEALVRTYFYVHKLVGYVLATLLVVGLTGLARSG